MGWCESVLSSERAPRRLGTVVRYRRGSWVVPWRRGMRPGYVQQWEHQLRKRVLRGGQRATLGRVRGGGAVGAMVGSCVRYGA